MTSRFVLPWFTLDVFVRRVDIFLWPIPQALCVSPALILPGSPCCSINKPKPLWFWSMGLVVCLGPVSLSSCLARCQLAFRKHISAPHHWLCSLEPSSAPPPFLPPELKLAVSLWQHWVNTQVHLHILPHTHHSTSASSPFVLDARPLTLMTFFLSTSATHARQHTAISIMRWLWHRTRRPAILAALSARLAYRASEEMSPFAAKYAHNSCQESHLCSSTKETH